MCHNIYEKVSRATATDTATLREIFKKLAELQVILPLSGSTSVQLVHQLLEICSHANIIFNIFISLKIFYFLKIFFYISIKKWLCCFFKDQALVKCLGYALLFYHQ